MSAVRSQGVDSRGEAGVNPTGKDRMGGDAGVARALSLLAALLSIAVLFFLAVSEPGLASESSSRHPAPVADSSSTHPALRSFLVGADLSGLAEVERHGAVFRGADGTPGDALALLVAHGLEVVRVRLWYGVVAGAGGSDDALALARRARALGLGFWLDVHYSETWADPGRQETPRAWRGLEAPALADSVEAYTARTLDRFRAEGLTPDFMQIGNETSAGMLWPVGRLDDWSDAEAWDRLAALFAAGARGARGRGPAGAAGAAGDPGRPWAPIVCLHLETSLGPNGVARYLDEIAARRVEVDAVALSYYPWWHGDLSRLDAVVSVLEARKTPWYLAEVAYPWSLEGFDGMGNLVGRGNDLVHGYRADAAGQANYLRALRERVAATRGGRGVLYWAPEWVSAPGAPSPWENCAWFDVTGRILPAAGFGLREAVGGSTRGARKPGGAQRLGAGSRSRLDCGRWCVGVGWQKECG